MNAIFHRAKHWQLFIILIGTALCFQFATMLIFASQIAQFEFTNRPPDLSGVMWLFCSVMIIIFAMIFGWMWSIGWGLKDKLPDGVRLNFKLFRGFMIYLTIYIIISTVYMGFMFSMMFSVIGTRHPELEMLSMIPYLIGFILLIPLNLFALFCMFYVIYFCAKLLKSIELGREAEVHDYIGNFFLFMFYVVGVWIIQPKVNQITSGDWTPPPNTSRPQNPLPSNRPINPTSPTPTPAPLPAPKEVIPRGERLRTKNHDAFNHDDDFDGIL